MPTPKLASQLDLNNGGSVQDSVVYLACIFDKSRMFAVIKKAVAGMLDTSIYEAKNQNMYLIPTGSSKLVVQSCTVRTA